MALWELDRDFDEYFTNYSLKELEEILNIVNVNEDKAREHIEIHKEQIEELKGALKRIENALKDSETDLIVMDKMKDAALVKIDYIKNN